MAGAGLSFTFDSPADERRFLRSYLPDAWDRFEAADYFEAGWFWAYGQFAEYGAGPDGGFVRVVFDGDPDALVEAERDRWAAVEGLADWDLRRYAPDYDSLLAQQQAAKGERGGEWEYRLKTLLSRFALDYYREFDSPIPAVDESTGTGTPMGFWTVLHNVLVQCGYDWYDETEACQRALRNRMKSIAAYRGADAAREEHARLLADWEAFGSELEAWMEENETGDASVP